MEFEALTYKAIEDEIEQLKRIKKYNNPRFLAHVEMILFNYWWLHDWVARELDVKNGAPEFGEDHLYKTRQIVKHLVKEYLKRSSNRLTS